MDSATRTASTSSADVAQNKLEIAERRPEDLTATAWQISEDFGWAKTYDSEYIALAKLHDCRLVTLDSRLRRGANRLGFVVDTG